MTPLFNKLIRTVLKESPDRIYEPDGAGGVRSVYYYHHRNSYTVLLDTLNQHYFTIKDTRLLHGHSDFKAHLRDSDLPADVHVITNFPKALKDPEYSWGHMIRSRIWADHKIMSFWDKKTPKLVSVSIDALRALKQDPNTYVYEVGDMTTTDRKQGCETYDQFVGNADKHHTDAELRDMHRKEVDAELLKSVMRGDYNKNKMRDGD